MTGRPPRKSKLTSVAGIVMALLACAAPGISQEDLHKQITELQDAQRSMRKELDRLEALLTGQPTALEDVHMAIDGASQIGDRNARIAIVEFSDFQCPYCGNYFSHVYPIIYNDYVRTGKVIYFFRDFPLDSLHPAAAKAAEAARCAGDQGKFREMHDRLFGNQQTLGVKYLPIHADALGLDRIQFSSCLDSGKYTEQVKKDVEAGQRLGVNGTPSFFLGRFDAAKSKVDATMQLNGAQPYSTFQENLDKLLASR